MRTPADWHAAMFTVSCTTKDTRAFIAAIQRDAIEACAAEVEDVATAWDEDHQPALDDAAACIRALLTEGRE